MQSVAMRLLPCTIKLLSLLYDIATLLMYHDNILLDWRVNL